MNTQQFRGSIFLALAAALIWAGCGREPGPAVSEPNPPPPPAVKSVALTQAVSIESPAYGTLTLQAPAGTQTIPAPAAAGEPVTASVRLRAGAPSEIKVTIMGTRSLMPDFGSEASLKQELDTWAETVLKGKTVEQDLAPTLVTSDTVTGFYLAATDAAPAPGQPTHIFNGFFTAGDGVFMLGSVYADDPAAALETILPMIKSATWTGKPKAAPVATSAEEPLPAPPTAPDPVTQGK